MNAIKSINNLFVKQLPTRTSLYKDTTHSLVQKNHINRKLNLKKQNIWFFMLIGIQI